MKVAAQSADDDAPQPRSTSSMEYAPASHRADERRTRLRLGNADAEQQLPSPHIAGETDNESARRPDTRQYVAASTGGGKSHLAAAIGLALIENGWRVLFTRTTDLVQKLQVARRELDLEAAINRLDRFDLLILDDLAYVTKDQAETSVLFELISARYERRSMLITANQPFGEWGKLFPDPAMTLAAVDRLVHHATILEMNVESYRRRTALERKRGPGRPPSRATTKTVAD